MAKINPFYGEDRMGAARVILSVCLLLILAPAMTSAQHVRAPLTSVQTKEAERRLADLGYWAGAVDGRFDAVSRSALISFQKWEGRAVTGRLTIEELEALRSGAPPVPRDGDYEHAEVDVDRQVLLISDGKGGVRVLPVSTGTDKLFVWDGQTSIAYTPR